MNEYERKQEARRKRLIARAERANAQSDQYYQASRDAVAHIPFGQPILVGHHSERSHRNTLARSHRYMDKCCEKADEAKELRARADAVGTGGISADDPDAVAKLRKKLEDLEVAHSQMKVINKVIHRHQGHGERAAALAALGYAPDQVEKLLKKDPMGCVGFPSYALKNSNANIRRVRMRIAELEEARGNVYTEREHGPLRIVEDPEVNRIRIFFPDKPNADVRATLKRRGFRCAFSHPDFPWQRKLNNQGRYAVAGFLEWYDAQPK